MDFEVSYSIDNEQQFWEELDEIVTAQCWSHELIDNALRSYLRFTTDFKKEYLQSETDIARCSYRLLESPLFTAHSEYIRRQIVHSLLQEDDGPTLHLIAAFLLSDGRHNEGTFEMMNMAGAFPRLVELIQSRKDDDLGLHRLLLELLYEMSRMSQLLREDLMTVDDAFIQYLFQVIEEASDDVNDPYHYPVIKVLLALNEQYMLSSHTKTVTSPTTPQQPPPMTTNRVIKLLSTQGSQYKTFGENIILLLNRESETSLQLLILKVLYLLFTTRSTYEYFYTNDLHVLVDVIIRNLLDLPEESSALRHTYLRVLHPLLAYTQLSTPPHYKREEVIKMLRLLINVSSGHFAPADETTIRLVDRCANVPWLSDEADKSPTEWLPEGVVAKRKLGMQLSEARESSLSVVEVAAHKEKPGVLTPSLSKEKRDYVSRDEHAENGHGDGLTVGSPDEAGRSPFLGEEEMTP